MESRTTTYKITVESDPEVAYKFESYPEHIQPLMNKLRNFIIETASENQIKHIEETLKWGEPSYIAKNGSTLRIDWKEKAPVQYALYLKCTSKLVPSFKKIFGESFRYEKNRAILFDLHTKIPWEKLKECIRVTLQYHEVKHLPDLGLNEDTE